MNFIFDREQLEELNSTITLFKKFDRYKEHKRSEIYEHLEEPFKLKQYKTIKDEDGNVVAFANWALFNMKSEKMYTEHLSIDRGAWNSGLRVWLIDIVCVRDTNKLMKWIINYFKKFLLVGERINWLRLDDQFNIIRKSFKEKKSYHGQ